MICQQCVERFPFLKALEPVLDVESTRKNYIFISTDSNQIQIGICSHRLVFFHLDDPASKSGNTKEEEGMPPAKRARTTEFCLSKTNKREGKMTRILFEDEAWREKLCKCIECKVSVWCSKLKLDRWGEWVFDVYSCNYVGETKGGWHFGVSDVLMRIEDMAQTSI